MRTIASLSFVSAGLVPTSGDSSPNPWRSSLTSAVSRRRSIAFSTSCATRSIGSALSMKPVEAAQANRLGAAVVVACFRYRR